jgi:hypothetical protein
MGSKPAVIASLLFGLAFTGQVVAQSTVGSSAKAGESPTALLPSAHQPLNLKLASGTATDHAGAWNGERTLATQPNPFASMFQKQAENGDPRRVPMYLLVPFAKGTSSTGNPLFGRRVANPANQPNVVQDVGALVRTIQSGG